jgi:hypothetical protein
LAQIKQGSTATRYAYDGMNAVQERSMANTQRFQPNYFGCEGGRLQCELALINAYFERYFCACIAVLPTSSRT